MGADPDNPYLDVPIAVMNFSATSPLPSWHIEAMRQQRFVKTRKLANWGEGGNYTAIKGFMSSKRLLPGFNMKDQGAVNQIPSSPTGQISPAETEYTQFAQVGVVNLTGAEANGGLPLPSELTVYAYCKFFDRRPFSFSEPNPE